MPIKNDTGCSLRLEPETEDNAQHEIEDALESQKPHLPYSGGDFYF